MIHKNNANPFVYSKSACTVKAVHPYTCRPLVVKKILYVDCLTGHVEINTHYDYELLWHSAIVVIAGNISQAVITVQSALETGRGHC